MSDDLADLQAGDMVLILVQRVSALTRAVSEMLVWVEQTESRGAVVAGTFDRARLILQHQNLQREVTTYRQVLSDLDDHDVPMVRERLTGIIQRLESRMNAVTEELGGDEEVCTGG